MANKNFGQFTQDVAPTTSQFVVGYNTAVSGGERRFALSDILGLFRTQVFSAANGILQANGSGSVSAISIGTSLSFSAGTLNTIQGLRTSDSPTFAGITLSSALTVANGGTGAATLTANALLLGNTTSAILSSDITYSTPTLSVPASFGITGAGSLAFTAALNSNITANLSGSGFLSVVGGGVRLDGTARSLSAWGTTGPGFSALARTITDSSSSGTVATAVANSFAVPTFAASSVTTFTNAANLYIAGDVAAGTNVTLTNSYGLWNAGKTRLDGVTRITDTTATSSSITGALVVSGGGGFGGNINCAGQITSSASGLTGNFQSAFQVIPTFTATASGFNAGFYSGPTTANTAVTYPLVAGMYIDDITKGAASTVTVQTGLYIKNQTKGATNYAIQAGTGLTTFADTTEATSSATGSITTLGGIFATKQIVSGSHFIRKVSALTYASPTSVDVTLADVYTVTTVNATGSVTFNATAGGTAGQSMTIIITNDATSAKTITFGTNFVANGTLTPSGVNKVATITFMSNGTNFYETSRTVLP